MMKKMIQSMQSKLACYAQRVMIAVLLLAVQTVQAATNVDKTALTTAIGEAETYLGSIQESNANEAKVLASVIDGCKVVLNNAESTQTDVDFATTATNESVGQCKIAVARNTLSAAIAEGEEYLSSIKEKYPEQAQEMSALIGNCKYTLNHPDAVLAMLEFCIYAMEEGTRQVKTEVARNALAAAIAEGEEYLSSIKEKYPEQAQEMSALIGNCKDMQNHPDAVLETLEFCIYAMEGGTNLVKTEVARIDFAATITLAEEYMGSCQESIPCVASVLQAIVGTAKEMKDDTSLTLSDLTFANAIVDKVIGLAKESGTLAGISAAKAAARMAAAYYDLSGRRVTQPSRTGVYINNGKKTVVK
jgi:hypothetical protein